MVRCALVCHPETPPCTDFMIWVDVEQGDGGLIALDFQLEGDVGSIFLPALSDMPPQHTDGLWKTTCMEAFVRTEEEEGYSEINVSPSMQWAAYRFDAYRSGMRSIDIPEPCGGLVMQRTKVSIFFPVFLGAYGACHPSSIWHLALSAVIEETDGTKSYWALRHPPGPPDFHHADCFALTLPAPDAS